MQYLHTMVRVGDLEKSLDFYCNKLGLREVRRMSNEKGRYTLVYLAAPEDERRARDDAAPLLELTWNWDEHAYDGGRVFVTALGHPPAAYDGATYLQHLYGGLWWTATGRGIATDARGAP